MTKIKAYTALQDAFGREHAQLLAEHLETQTERVDLSALATKDDLKASLTPYATKDDLKDSEIRFLRELQKTREDLMTRMQWTAFIQILTTIAALIALPKLM